MNNEEALKLAIEAMELTNKDANREQYVETIKKLCGVVIEACDAMAAYQQAMNMDNVAFMYIVQGLQVAGVLDMKDNAQIKDKRGSN